MAALNAGRRLWLPAAPAIVGRPRLVTPGVVIVRPAPGGVVIWRCPDRYCRATPRGAIGPLPRFIPQYAPVPGSGGSGAPGSYSYAVPKYNNWTMYVVGASGGGGGASGNGSSTRGTDGSATSTSWASNTLYSSGSGGGAAVNATTAWGAGGYNGTTSGPAGYSQTAGWDGGSAGYATVNGNYERGGPGGATYQANFSTVYGASSGLSPIPGATMNTVVGTHGNGGNSYGNGGFAPGGAGHDGSFGYSWS